MSVTKVSSTMVSFVPISGITSTNVQLAIPESTANLAATVALKGANTDITSLASPALGAATATTQSFGDNTTKVATTAFVSAAVGSQIQPISASVAASALTISASALTLAFRSNTLTSGAVTTVLGTPANLVVPSGATLGAMATQSTRLIVLALNNAGTIELAVTKEIPTQGGDKDFSETNLLSTTAISAGATSPFVIYSATARTNLAYRVIGCIDITQAVAGAYSTAPSKVQGMGGNALTAMSSIGYGQMYSEFAGTGNRVAGTFYYNLTNKPILVNVYTTSSVASSSAILSVNSINVSKIQGDSTNGASSGTLSAIVPPGSTYAVTTTRTIDMWAELR